MLGTIVSPAQAPRPPVVCNRFYHSNSTSKRRPAEEQSYLAKRARPNMNTLRPVFPFQANVPSMPTPLFLEHVVSMES